MLNLTRLHLERTCVSDVGVGHLAALKQLQYLNLYGTAVTDAALDTLKTLPELKKLYVWQTKISAAGAKSYTHARTDPRQIEQWQHEIERLKQQIKDRQVTFEFGVDPSGVASKSPVNAECPVSGKPIDPARTLIQEGRTVAFCCDDCREKFRQDPMAFADKLAAAVVATGTNAPRTK